MKNGKSKCSILILFALALAFAVTASAQTSGNASLTGHVKDPQGANLPGARVRLYGRDRTFSLATTTDSTGTYQFERLAPGEDLGEGSRRVTRSK